MFYRFLLYFLSPIFSFINMLKIMKIPCELFFFFSHPSTLTWNKWKVLRSVEKRVSTSICGLLSFFAPLSEWTGRLCFCFFLIKDLKFILFGCWLVFYGFLLLFGFIHRVFGEGCHMHTYHGMILQLFPIRNKMT